VAGLNPGTYYSGVSVTGNADNSPLLISVQLVISNSAYYPVSGYVISGTTGIRGVVVTVTGDSALTVVSTGDGSFSLGNLRGGSYTVTPSSPYYSFSPPSLSLSPLITPRTDLLFNANTKQGAVKFHYEKGWNLISLPVESTTNDIAALFADAETPKRAYRYSPGSGYVEETQIFFGIGYWIKFTKSDSVTINGTLRGDFSAAVVGSSGGWNLVGGASGAVPVSAIMQTPAGSIISIYQFNPGVGYKLPPGDLLRSGRGYFVKVRNDATLGLFTSFTGTQQQLEDELAPSSLPDILGLPTPPDVK